MSNPDPNTDEYKIAVMQAHLRGEKIETRLKDDEECPWAVTDGPLWNWMTNDYRVASAPREIWVNEYLGGLSPYQHATKEKAKEDASVDVARQVRFIEAPAE